MVCQLCKTEQEYIDQFITEKGWLSKKVIDICYDCRYDLYEMYPEISGIKFKHYGGTFGRSVEHIDDFKDLDKLRNLWKKHIEKEKREKKEKRKRKKLIAEASRRNKKEKQEKKKALKVSIIQLLNDKSIKMPASDIDAHLKNKDVDEIKELCEKMYHDGKIGRTGNYRYFILTEQKKKTKSKKASAPKSEEVDVKAELKKFKEMLDDGLIEQEDYDAKKKELLGL